jgi:uroporphyrinogen III methyltransferase / synthase
VTGRRARGNEAGPLAGRSVVVTRARHQARAVGEELSALGAEVLYLPLIETVEPSSWEPLERALPRLAGGDYRWVAFTSVNGVRGFAARRGSTAIPKTVSVLAVGPRTAAELRAAGIEPDVVPDDHSGAGMAAALGVGPGRVLLARGEGAPQDIVELLTARGWIVDEVFTYRTVPAEPDPDALARVRAGRFDAVTFASPSAVGRFVEVVGALDSSVVVACIGPTTAAAARSSGLRVHAEAPDRSAAGLARAVAEALRS